MVNPVLPSVQLHPELDRALPPLKVLGVLSSLNLVILGLTELLWSDPHAKERLFVRGIGCVVPLATAALTAFPWGNSKMKRVMQIFFRSLGVSLSAVAATSTNPNRLETSFLVLLTIPMTFSSDYFVQE